jgi:two-component system, LuxR family, sensor kinase FixL
MEALSLIYLIFLVTCILTALSLSLRALTFWEFSGGKLFFAFALATAQAVGAFTLMSLSSTPDQAWIWARIRFFGVSAIVPLLLLFVLDYTGHNPLQKPALTALLFIIPVVTQCVVWSDFSIPLFLKEWSIVRAGYLMTEQSRYGGTWFVIYQSYTYLIGGLTYFFLIRHAMRSSGSVRRQTLLLLTGSLVATVVGFIPVFLGNRLPFSPAMIGYTATLGIYGWIIFHYRLFDTLPIAYRTVFFSLQDAVIVLNNRAQVLELNEAALLLFGGDIKKIHHQPFQKILFECGYSDPLPKIDSLQSEMMLNSHIFDVNVSTLHTSSSNSIGKVLVFRDITRLKSVKGSLRRSEALYRLLADNSSDMILLTLISGTVVYASPACSQRTGYSNSELLAMSEQERNSLIYKEDFEHVREVYDHAVMNSPSLPIEYRLVKKDGSHFWVEAQITPISDATGTPTQLLSVIRDISDRKAIESEMRQSEQLYRLLADNSSDMISLHAPDGRFIYVSPSYTRFTGYSSDELINMPVEHLSRLVHPDDLSRTRDEAHRRVINGQTITELEYRRRHKNGSHSWVEVHSTPIFNASHEVIQILMTSRDINDRKRTEDALRESNHRYDTLVENIPVMVYQVRRTPSGEYRFDYVSPMVRKHNRLEPEAIIANPQLLFGQKHPDDFPSLAAAQEESARNLTPFAWEGRDLIDGQVFWTRLQSIPARLEDGTVIWNGVESDITARKEAEIALEHSRKMIERITKMLPDVIHVFDLTEHKPIYVNREFNEILGYTLDEFLQLGANYLEQLMHPDDYAVEQTFGNRYASLLDDEIIETEYRWQHKTKGFVWLNVREMVYERDADGRAVQILGTLRNVTERKISEEQRRELTLQLEAANRDLKDFAYIISHDLKAPLRGVSSIAHWLTSQYGDKFDAEGQELIVLLGGRVRRMEQMISGVLEYSRIGHKIMRGTSIDLNDVMTQIIQDIVPGERIKVIVENNLPILNIDPVRIRQVFQNLIDNSVKFMDKPEGEIRIGCERQGENWCFWVQDNGPGIAEEHFERIFQMFQTLVSRDKTENTGIGLTLIKRIIELYKGNIWLTSTPGQGSTFYFTLPNSLTL